MIAMASGTGGRGDDTHTGPGTDVMISLVLRLLRRELLRRHLFLGTLLLLAHGERPLLDPRCTRLGQESTESSQIEKATAEHHDPQRDG